MRAFNIRSSAIAPAIAATRTPAVLHSNEFAFDEQSFNPLTSTSTASEFTVAIPWRTSP